MFYLRNMKMEDKKKVFFVFSLLETAGQHCKHITVLPSNKYSLYHCSTGEKIFLRKQPLLGQFNNSQYFIEGQKDSKKLYHFSFSCLYGDKNSLFSKISSCNKYFMSKVIQPDQHISLILGLVHWI